MHNNYVTCSSHAIWEWATIIKLFIYIYQSLCVPVFVCLSVCLAVLIAGTLWAYFYVQRYLVGLDYLVGLVSQGRGCVYV